jgi:hypothetical protein
MLPLLYNVALQHAIRRVKKLQNEELCLHNFSLSTNIIRVVKLRIVRQARHVARMGEMRNTHTILVGKPERKRPLGRWKDHIKMGPKK